MRLARPQGGVFSREQALAAGLTADAIDNRLRSARFVAIHKAVYALSPVITEHGRRTAAILASVSGAALADISAADLWGYCLHPGGPHHVIVPAGGGRGVAGVVTHRTRGFVMGDVVRVGNLLVTSPARTLLDLGLRLGRPQLRTAIAQAQYAKLVDPAALAAAIAAHPGHRGARALRRADPGLQVFAETESPLEDELLALILGAGLPRPAQQIWLRGISGRRHRVDFLYRQAGVVVEADGRTAHARAMAFEDDRDRDTDLAAVGFLTLRFTRVQVRTAGRAVTTRIGAVLAGGGSARR